jgi:transcriptional regulator with GAF, ATPase, and Fis domain
VIAATNRSLLDIESGRVFRNDFYYRLCSDIITVPPLRERIRESTKELDDLLKFTVKRMVGQSSGELVAMVRGVIDSRLGRHYAWPGNVRELEQCVRRVLLKRDYAARITAPEGDRLADRLARELVDGTVEAQRLVNGYCAMLHQRHGTFEEVARRTGLDRRTVKKYINAWDSRSV